MFQKTLEKTNILVLPTPKDVSFDGEKLKEKPRDFMLKEKIRKRKWKANIRKGPVKRKKIQR